MLNAKVTDKNLQQGSDDDCIYLPTPRHAALQPVQRQELCCNYEDESRANEAKAVVESGLHDLLKSDNAYYIYSAASGWRR